MTPKSDVPAFPRGIEILVKKASVDAEFRGLLLAKRSRAAREIDLGLNPAEAAMLDAVPAAQLEAIIAQTVVSPMTRAAFLGRAAAAMLAALAASAGVPDAVAGVRGIMPDRPQPQFLYDETDYRGELSCGLVAQNAWNVRLAESSRTNRVLDRAYELARGDWSADPAHANVPFPMPAPQLVQLRRLGLYRTPAQAQAALQQRQQEIAQQAAEARRREDERLAALSAEEREREQRGLELLRAAQRLFETRLRELVASIPLPAPMPVPSPPGPVPVPPGPVPMPIGPPAATGSRPDRP